MLGIWIRSQSLALMLSVSLAPVSAGCGSGSVTSPTGLTLAGTLWSGPFADNVLGSGTMTLTFGPSEDAEGRWSLSMAGLSLIAGLRVIPRSRTDLPDAVTLGLATANLDRDCDMLLIARVNGSEMEGTLRSGRCDLQGERVVAVRLTRR